MEKFSILKHLPPYGDLPEQFSSAGHGMHSEGFVVEFHPENLPVWVGNFGRGGSNYNQVLEHPNPDYIFVVAGGEGYVVNLNDRKLIEEFGCMIVSFLKIEEKNILIFNHHTDLIACGYQGKLWQTTRIAWDGIQNLKLDRNFIIGEAWSVGDQWVRVHPTSDG